MKDGTYIKESDGYIREVTYASGYSVGIRNWAIAAPGESLNLENLPQGEFGIWTDPDSNKVYVDLSLHVENYDVAVAIARELGEIAIWDWSKMEAINV
jgi:hypothetical protein